MPNDLLIPCHVGQESHADELPAQLSQPYVCVFVGGDGWVQHHVQHHIYIKMVGCDTQSLYKAPNSHHSTTPGGALLPCMVRRHRLSPHPAVPDHQGFVPEEMRCRMCIECSLQNRTCKMDRHMVDTCLCHPTHCGLHRLHSLCSLGNRCYIREHSLLDVRMCVDVCGCVWLCEVVWCMDV